MNLTTENWVTGYNLERNGFEFLIIPEGEGVGSLRILKQPEGEHVMPPMLYEVMRSAIKELKFSKIRYKNRIFDPDDIDLMCL